MPKTLTLSAPKQFQTFYGGHTVTWDLLDEKGVGYRISWIAKAFDTHMPECMAFACKHDTRGIQWTDYREQAVIHNPDAALALNEVLAQLSEKHGYIYGIDLEPTQIMPGEVVADGNR